MPRVTEKHVVIVSREWDNPTIAIDVTDKGLAVSIDLDAFLTAVAQEYGNPASTITQSQHLARLRAGAAAVTDKMKLTTTRVM